MELEQIMVHLISEKVKQDVVAQFNRLDSLPRITVMGTRALSRTAVGKVLEKAMKELGDREKEHAEHARRRSGNAQKLTPVITDIRCVSFPTLVRMCFPQVTFAYLARFIVCTLLFPSVCRYVSCSNSQ